MGDGVANTDTLCFQVHIFACGIIVQLLTENKEPQRWNAKAPPPSDSAQLKTKIGFAKCHNAQRLDASRRADHAGVACEIRADAQRPITFWTTECRGATPKRKENKSRPSKRCECPSSVCLSCEHTGPRIPTVALWRACDPFPFHIDM